MKYRSELELDEQFAHLEKLLKEHDWAYEMSDDPRVYQRGTRQSQAILCIMDDLSAYDEQRVSVLWAKYADPWNKK